MKSLKTLEEPAHISENVKLGVDLWNTISAEGLVSCVSKRIRDLATKIKTLFCQICQDFLVIESTATHWNYLEQLNLVTKSKTSVVYTKKKRRRGELVDKCLWGTQYDNALGLAKQSTRLVTVNSTELSLSRNAIFFFTSSGSYFGATKFMEELGGQNSTKIRSRD